MRFCAAENYRLADVVSQERAAHQTTNLSLNPTEMMIAVSVDTSGWYPVILHFMIVDLNLV